MTSPALTPFLSTLVDEVRARLLLAAGIEPERVSGFAVKQRAGSPGEWLAEITITDAAGSFLVDLFGKASARDAWFRTAHFAYAYRATASFDPFAAPSTAAWLKSLRERMTARDVGEGTPEIRAALDELGRFLPFASLRDESFRWAMPATDGGGGAGNGILWLGFGCNQDCSICWQGRSWPSPPLAMYEQWLDEMIAGGVRSLVLSGGEPTLIPSLPELIARARRAGVYVVLESNGLRLREPDYRRALADAGLGEVFVSLHAADPRVSDEMTRTPGTHALTVAGLAAWLEDGLGGGVHCVVDRRNAAALPEHARFVVDRFVTPYRSRPGAAPLKRVSYSFPTRYFDEETYRRQMIPLDEARAPLSAAIHALRTAGIDVQFLGMSGFPLCAFDGARDELPRLSPVGPGPHDGRAWPAPCQRCDARPKCLGVHEAYLEAQGPRGLDPVEPIPGR